MTQDKATELSNFDVDTGRIKFSQFREYYKLPADITRMICKKLGYKVIREGAEQYIVGENPYGVSNSYYLKHAVMEYRKTMYLKNTIAGNFAEYELDTPEGTVQYGVSSIENEEDIKPIFPSIRKEPNKEKKTMLVPADKGAELLLRQAAPPPAAPAATAAMDPLQMLAAALVEAQKAAAAPDPLAPQRALLEAEQNGFLITTDQLGELVGMTKSTISSKKSGFRKLGFEFEKAKEGSTTLWRVKRY